MSRGAVTRARGHWPWPCLTLTWRSARAVAAGQPGHQSAIRIWSPGSTVGLRSPLTRSLTPHISLNHFTIIKGISLSHSLPTRVITYSFLELSFVSLYSTGSGKEGCCSVKRRKTSIFQNVVDSEVISTIPFDRRYNFDLNFLWKLHLLTSLVSLSVLVTLNPSPSHLQHNSSGSKMITLLIAHNIWNRIQINTSPIIINKLEA